MNKLLTKTAGFVAGLFGGYVLIVISAAVLTRFPGMTEAHAASMTDMGVLLAPFGAVVSGLMCSIGTLRVVRRPRAAMGRRGLQAAAFAFVPTHDRRGTDRIRRDS